MASFPQAPFFSPLKPTKTGAFSIPLFHPKGFSFSSKFKNLRVSFSLGPSSAEYSSSNPSEKPSEPGPGEADPVKLAFAKAKAYKKAIETTPTPNVVQNPVQDSDGVDKKADGSKEGDSKAEDKDEGKGEAPLSVKLAFEKAKEYKKSQDVADGSEFVKESERTSDIVSEIESERFSNDANKKEELKVSSIDFVGLDFSEKKRSRGLPAGLVPVVDSFSEGDVPDVEILVGDASKFGDEAATSKPNQLQEDDIDLYKPKVSTWGVFPRPSDISKTYGGGRTIHPGEELETAGDRAAKEARTRQLLAAYKSKIGLHIHPKLKSECEKALKEADSLMDLGKLKEALPLYEEVMDKLAFQNELYGLAALQWSICQDSLSRPNEARVMYEKLQSHPNVQVRKKAMQFMFGFQAMEMMKVASSTRSPSDTGYQNYFEAFINDRTNYPLKEAEVDEDALSQALVSMIFLFSPIFIMVLIAFLRR